MVEESKNIQNSLTTMSALNGTVSLSSQALSAQTLSKLKDLGIDTTNIKTEEDGLAVLAEAELLLEENKKQAENERKQKEADENIHYRLKKLARELGIFLNEYEPVSKMIEKTAQKIRTLNADSKDEVNNQKTNKQRSEYQDILKRYLNSQKESQKLDDNLNNIAYYNKLYQQLRS